MPAASQRRTASARFEIRTFDPGSRTFTGYASTFGGTPDSYGDVVARGAFARTLRERAGKIALLWQHDTAQPIGVWEEIREDAHGLLVRGRLVETQAANDAYVLLKAGAVTGLSIGFRTVGAKLDPDGLTRILTEVELFEISLVTMPANDDARVLDVRSRALPLTDAAIDRFCTRLRASDAKWRDEFGTLSARVDALVATAPAAPSVPVIPHAVTLAQHAALYQARMAHYRLYHC